MHCYFCRTIYGSKEITNAGPKYPPPPRFTPRSAEENFLQPENIDVKKERGYILETLPRSLRSPKEFVVTNIIHEYNKPVNSDKDEDSYGSPRHSMDLRNYVKKKPNVQTVSCPHVHDSNKLKVKDKSHWRDNTVSQFCEVLGPSSCNKCIEEVNRRIASDIQREGLPELDSMLTTVVAPKLANLMTRGDSMIGQKWKKRPKTKDKAKSFRFPSLGKNKAVLNGGAVKLWEKSSKNACQNGV